MKQSIQDLAILNFQLSRQLRLINADLKNRGIHKSARELFLFLWRGAHARKPNGKRLLPKGPIFKVETLAALLEVHERTVQRNIRLLERHGLLHVSANKPSRRGGHPTNRLWPVWHPACDTAPLPHKVTAPLDAASDQSNASDQDRFQMEATAVFVWPEMSPSMATPCHHDEATQTQPPPTFERSFAPARFKERTYSKSDQPIPGRPVYVLDSAADVRLFLLLHLETYGVSRSVVDEWIAKFGLARTAQVAQWVFSSKAGAIKQPGGWMRLALEQQWTAPTPIAKARKAALAEARAQQYANEAAAKEEAAKEQSAAVDAERDAVWRSISGRLEELPELYALAEAKARVTLSTMFHVFFIPGNPTWRTFLIDAALQHPGLWHGPETDISA